MGTSSTKIPKPPQLPKKLPELESPANDDDATLHSIETFPLDSPAYLGFVCGGFLFLGEGVATVNTPMILPMIHHLTVRTDKRAIALQVHRNRFYLPWKLPQLLSTLLPKDDTLLCWYPYDKIEIVQHNDQIPSEELVLLSGIARDDPSRFLSSLARNATRVEVPVTLPHCAMCLLRCTASKLQGLLFRFPPEYRVARFRLKQSNLVEEIDRQILSASSPIVFPLLDTIDLCATPETTEEVNARERRRHNHVGRRDGNWDPFWGQHPDERKYYVVMSNQQELDVLNKLVPPCHVDDQPGQEGNQEPVASQSPIIAPNLKKIRYNEVFISLPDCYEQKPWQPKSTVVVTEPICGNGVAENMYRLQCMLDVS